MQNHYVNHNKRMLQEVAGEQHQQWLKERDQRALKWAKKDVAPMLGYRLNSLDQLKGI
jgi:hypothetical protein